MSVEDICTRFLIENPKYIEILKRAVEYEESHIKDTGYLGWEWYNVRAYPAELMKLVRAGLVKIRYRSRRYTCYALTDREAIKKCLKKFGVTF